MLAFEKQGGTPLNWGLRARVVCAAPLPGDELDFRLQPTSSPLFRRISAADARCDTGKTLVGFGLEITAGFGPPPKGQVIIDDITPGAGLTGVTVKAVRTSGTATWGLVAWFRCANDSALPGIQRVPTTRLHKSFSWMSAVATCPAGKRVLAAGGDLTGPGGRGRRHDRRARSRAHGQDRLHERPAPARRSESRRAEAGRRPGLERDLVPSRYAICTPV